ncbi:dynein heavy chain and region D6 of dynein motor-domain-containing protein [Obelidium mucronatum]|nr:dynein heavy chain and region D6 of dynein motor-domain-containing protein [Obelidium mucronatum]
MAFLWGPWALLGTTVLLVGILRVVDFNLEALSPVNYRESKESRESSDAHRKSSVLEIVRFLSPLINKKKRKRKRMDADSERRKADSQRSAQRRAAAAFEAQSAAAAAALADRLYTVAARLEKPHFQLGPRGSPAAPSASAEPNSGTRPLRARKPAVIPASSTKHRRSSATLAERPPSMDFGDLQNIIRPRKRSSERAELERLAMLPPALAAGKSPTLGFRKILFRQSHPRLLQRRLPPASDPDQLQQHPRMKRVRVTEPDKDQNENNTMEFELTGLPHHRRKSVVTPSSIPTTAAAVAPPLVPLAPIAKHQKAAKFKDIFAFIKHLEKHPKSQEFAYLVPVSDGPIKGEQTVFNPYNLEFADYSDLDKSRGYYTMSLEGVTCINEKGTSNFTPLTQFIRERNLFNSLLQIPFFKRYRLWKSFVTWKRNVLRTKIQFAKSQLTKNLFLADSHLRDPLLIIRARCMDVIKRSRLVKIDYGKSYELATFIGEQQAWVKNVADGVLVELEKSIREIVSKAGTDCLNERGFSTQLAQDCDDEENEGDKLSFMQQATRRTECSRLQRFVKLVDYHVVNTLRMLATESVGDLLKAIYNGCTDADVVVKDLEEDAYTLMDIDCTQVGGIVVGREVGTKELIDCGFERFPIILTRIHRTTLQTLGDGGGGADDESEAPQVSATTTSDSHHAPIKKKKNDLLGRKQARPICTPFQSRSSGSTWTQPPKVLFINPSVVDHLTCVDTLLKLYISAVEKFELISNTIPFFDPANLTGGSYVTAANQSAETTETGPKASAIILEDGYFREICGRIRGALVGIFGNAGHWMKNFNGVKEMWVNNQSFDGLTSLDISAGPLAVLFATAEHAEGEVGSIVISKMKELEQIALAEAMGTDQPPPETRTDKESVLELSAMFEKQSDGTFASPIVNYFSRELDKFMKQRQEMGAIPTSSKVNNLSIDTVNLKSILLPSPERCFADVAKLLTAFKNSLALVDKLFDEVSRLYTLIDTYKIKIPPTELAMFQTLGPTLRQLKEAADMASDTKDDNIAKFSADLEKQLFDLTQSAFDWLLDTSGKLQEMIALKGKYEQWAEIFKNGGVPPVVGAEKKEGEEEKAPPKPGETDLSIFYTSCAKLTLNFDTTGAGKLNLLKVLNTEEINTQIAAYIKVVYSLDKGLPPNDVVPKLKQLVDSYKSMYTTIVDLRNPSLKTRHWDKIQEILGKPLIRDETLTLEKLIEQRIFDFKEDISNTSGQASSEAALEEMLSKVVKLWSDTEFIVLPYRDSKDVFILGAIDDIQTALEDSQVTIATIKASRFVGPIKTEVERWDRMLMLFSETLDAWMVCQRNWLVPRKYFLCARHPTSNSRTKRRMFQQVDRSWKDAMRKVSRNPNAMKSGTIPGLLEAFQQNNGLLDQIQKCLEDYLESKRLLFPRFYFLSNDELLEILSQTRNPQAVQPHLSKCFDAIKIPEGEKVPFLKTIKARGNVEAWLSSVEEGMVAVLKKLTKVALIDYESKKRTDWVREHAGQVVVTANQVIWCRDVIESIKNPDPNKELQNMKQKCINNLAGLATLVRGDLTKIQRAILGALITIDVHNRDIMQGLINAKVSGLNDFEWTKQLRYYWDMEVDTCQVKMSSSVFNYGYEYLGCSPRLVITPLTDRCYLTLTGAMQLNLGGSPVGPAGTGKTETVKDLAKAMARQCVVFNCSDGMDYKMMGKMFAGLAQSGAWICFDEFNRIDIEVLSVIAQQLLTIKSAKDSKSMNPGYAGRTELPDNLKALFRPISMMIPDYGLISEIMLFSEGFESAKALAGKNNSRNKTTMILLSNLVLSRVKKGMRAVKSVLIMAGALKRSHPELTEQVVLIRSLRDSNLPKFLVEDISLFKGILQDLFPGIVVKEEDFEVLNKMIKEVMKEKNLEIVDAFVTRVCQLFETNRIRHGVMLVGYDTIRTHFDGDFSLILLIFIAQLVEQKQLATRYFRKPARDLKELMPNSQDFQKVKTWVLNPKCVAMTELYGEFNLATMEWKDGLIGIIFREQVADDTPDDKWTVLDGPVDALWIENMNTVLDDNKLLTLINGERIKMNNTMHMLFEVNDLAVASPATVYMDPASIGWWPYVKSWIRKFPERVPDELKTYLHSLFETYVGYRTGFYETHVQGVYQICQFQSCCFSLQSSFRALLKILKSTLLSSLPILKTLFSHIFLFCYVWSIGGNLADGNQDLFDTFVRDTLEAKPIADISLPSLSVFSYYVNIKRRTFGQWDELVPSFSYNSEIPYFKMIVPTQDTVKYSYLLEALLTNGYRTLFGGAKRMALCQVSLNFSAQTNSIQTQQAMEAKLEKKRKGILGAPSGFRKIVLFVDDLNMPKLDTYGSQPPIELIRQYIDFGGFYDREIMQWKDVQDIEIVTCCAPPGRHFNMLNIPAPSEQSDGFLKPFSSEVKGCSEAIVLSSIEIYRSMCSELLPTPAKSHYTFNLRDLSKVVQGILQIRPVNIQTKLDIVKTFCHEASRVFHDRLIDDADRAYYNKLLSELVEKNFSVSLPSETMGEKPIMFGDFAKKGVPADERQYVEFQDMNILNTLLEEYLEEYNVTMNKELRLIFFLDAKQHITRISRIIRQPRGNALLVGVGGCGKQSYTRLACHISDFHCFQVELTRTYGEVEWHEDLKKLYIAAGVEGKNSVFLLSDTQIKTESFLEDVNNILNSGEVPNLFPPEEREKIFADLRPLALVSETTCISSLPRVPVGDTFRNRCRMFPSLVNCCTIDWFDEWPREALLSVSKRFLEYVELGSNETKANIAQMCVEVHSSVGATAKRFYAELRRRYYTTPTSYLELINLYVSMLQEKRKELGAARDRLVSGLNKLAETNELVANMQVELNSLGPVLKQSAIDVEALMIKIAKDQEVADAVRKVVAEEEAIVRVKANDTQAFAENCQKDLDEALPALDAAYKALDALDKKDIAELKVFAKPPDAVLMVMEAICILFKMKPDWENSKKLLGDPQFMKKMAEYDKDNIPEAIQKKVKKYTENPAFTPEAIERVSKACKSIGMWVIAMDIYSRVFKEVAPKKKKLEEAQETLETTRAALAAKAAALQEVEDQLNKLKETYDNSIRSKKQLADKMEETTMRMARAGKLTLALADEQIRWTESVASMNFLIDQLVGNIFLCAASVAYYGAFTTAYRQDLVLEWMKQCRDFGVPVTDNFSLLEHLVDPAVVRDWNIQGLPADTLSTENGILVTRGRRWPLMIDPQGQANRWIRNMEGTSLKVVKLSEPKFLRSLENAVRTGQPVLMEDVGEQLDPAIEPLLLKQTVRQGGRLLMKLGDSMIEYDRNFKLYITTKLSNPHYLPEVCIKVTIINFTVTNVGLEGQLLADVVKLERPELEEQRNSLIVNIANDKKQLKDIEEKILRLLFNSQGNILDDEELINTLNQSKVTSAAIKERVHQAEQTEIEINVAREKYRPVAIRGSVLYFVIANLAEMDPMYQFSLKYFKNLFNQCIVESPKADDLLKRIEILCNETTANIFSNVSRGLFEAHKLIYAFMIACSVMTQRGDITEAQMNFFLRGSSRLSDNDPPKPQERWFTTYMWQNCCDVAANIPEFAYILDHIQMYTSEWEELINSDNPFTESVPGTHETPLTDFHRLILIKALREEKLVSACVAFVQKNMGQHYIDIPPLDLSKAYKDTSHLVPLIFILSSGSDPISALMKFAATKDMSSTDKLLMISLGQGQGPIAEELIRRATKRGDWVFLQNCHLAASWMGRLENIIKDFATPETPINHNFRLFLSSMPSKVFPSSVLQDGVKVTNEPPKGLRANIARSFADISRDLFDEAPPQGVKFKKLLFGVCFFNAIIQERKKFGPLGWNICYDWSNSDLEVSIIMLKNTLQESKQIPWDALMYLTGEITFGGRVTDDWDRRTLNSILSKFYTPDILEDSYVFSPSGIYYAPKDMDLNGFKAYIDSLPFSEEPSIFGMHENANISYQMQEAKRVIKTILEVQPRVVSGGSGKTPEQVVSEIATAILDGLPGLLFTEPMPAGTQIPGKPDPMQQKEVMDNLFKKDDQGRMLNSLSTVLCQEAARFNKLLTLLKITLENLIKAVKGLVVMSAELEKVFQSLQNNEVPNVWAKAAYPSLKPLASWVKDLKLRVEFLNEWLDNGQPSSFWLPGLFYPQGFLTGILQNHSRKYNIPIDSLIFAYKVTSYETGDLDIDQDVSFAKPSTSKPATDEDRPETSPKEEDEDFKNYPDADGVLMRGLYIEGARWDRQKGLLQDSYPMEMFSMMPLIRFVPTQIPQKSSSLFVCPLYKTSARAGTLSTTGQSTNFVISVNLKTDMASDIWVAKGVALLEYWVDMIRSVQPTSRWKIVVVDSKSLRILNTACKMADILEENVTLVEDISRKRTSYPTKEAIYFISPTEESVAALVEDFTRPKPMYAKAHIFFTAPLTDALFEKIDRGQSQASVKFIGCLKEMNIDFLAQEEQVFTINHPHSLYHLYNPSSPTQTSIEIASMAKKLLSVFCTLGELPHIRYHDPTGEQDSLSYRLATALQAELDNLQQADPDFPPKSTFKQPVLILLDRSFDLMSPLIHEFTYQAMMNDLLVLEDGKYVFPSVIKQKTMLLTMVHSKSNDPNVKQRALLDESDAIWMLIRHWHFAEAVEYVRDNFNKFLVENKAAASILNSDPSKRGMDNLNDMKDTITSLPQFQEMKAKYSVHINICQECKSIFERRRLDAVAAVEQDLATGETAAGTAPRNIMMDMTPILIDTVIPPYDKLRILMLYIIAQEGIHDMDRKRLLDAAKLSLEDSQAITNLGYMGVRLSTNQDKKKKLTKEKYSYYGRVAEKRKKKKKKADGDLPYDLSRFVTMLKYILEDQLTGTLDTQLFPWLKTAPVEDAPQQAKASNIQKAFRSTNNALQPLPNAGNAYSLRTTRASWAKKPKIASGDGSGNNGAATIIGDAEDLRKNGSRTIVFIMGGVTYSEIRASYEVIKEYKRDIVLDDKRGVGSVESLRNEINKTHGSDSIFIPKSAAGSINNLATASAASNATGPKEEVAAKEKKPFGKFFKKKEKE